MQQTKKSLIVAQVIISESELRRVIKNTRNLKNNKKLLDSVLYQLGIDTSKSYLRQDFLKHRNRFGEIVKCTRWIGEERLDEEWLKSGYASQEALDKAGGSKLLESLYRMRGLTEDIQNILEERDTQYRN